MTSTRWVAQHRLGADDLLQGRGGSGGLVRTGAGVGVVAAQ
jgi:hypothetical protein